MKCQCCCVSWWEFRFYKEHHFRMWPSAMHIFCLAVTFLLPRLMSLTLGALGLLNRHSYLALLPLLLSACHQPAALHLHSWKQQFHLAHAKEALSSSRVVTCAFQGRSERSHTLQWAVSSWFVRRSLWRINCPPSVSFTVFDELIYLTIIPSHLRCLLISGSNFNIVLCVFV